jgi:HlyD family secretion protein
MKSRKAIPLAVLAAVITGSLLYFEVLRKLEFDPSRIEASGTIEVTELDVASKMAGRIVTIPVEEGDTVKENQTLVTLSYNELEPQKISARATLDNAERNFNRARSLFATGSVSQQAFDNARTAYANAKSQYEYVVASISNALLASPADGTVLKKNLEKGELAFPGTPIITIGDLAKPWIKIYLPETQIGKIRLGQSADITADSFPDKVFKGKITSIANKAEFTPKTVETKEDRVKMVFAVKIAVENPGAALKPGMPADARIRAE